MKWFVGMVVMAVVVVIGVGSLASLGPRTFAQEDPSDEVVAVERYVEALINEDIETLASLMDEDVVFNVPYTFSGDNSVPTSYEGRDATLAYLSGVFDTFILNFESVIISPVEDGGVVFVELQGDFVVDGLGLPYQNIYVVKVTFGEDGRAIQIDEYNNPVTIAVTFGLPLGMDAE